MLAQSGQLANTRILRLLLAPNGYKSQVQDHENYMCSMYTLSADFYHGLSISLEEEVHMLINCLEHQTLLH